MVELLPDAVARQPVHLPAGAAATRSSEVVGEYLFDCTDFRTDDKDDLLRQVYEMTDRRFALADHLLEHEAVGALRDGRDGAPTACTTASGSSWTRSTASTSPATPYENAILDYHRHVDGLDRRSCSRTPTTTRSCFVVSDHGAKRMDGGIRVNEWLRREGLLGDARASPSGSASLARRRRRLVADDGLGRRRLLRARSS